MVGDEEDVLDREFGPDLPEHAAVGARALPLLRLHLPLRPRARIATAPRCGAQLGYRDDERVILVSVGGTGWDATCSASARRRSPLVAAQMPDTRMVLVGGSPARPRGAAGGPAHRGAAVRAGSLTSTTPPSISPSCRAASPPRWSWRPSRRRSSTSRCAITSSSSYHVARRLDRLGAGVRMDYDRTSPEALGAAMLDHLGKPVQLRGGADRRAPSAPRA